jgi:hypothetical protein
MAYQPYQQPQYAHPARRTSQLAVWSMVVGIASVLLLLFARLHPVLGFAGCAVAVGLGIGALVVIRRDPYHVLAGRGMAVIGLMVAALGLFILGMAVATAH